MQRVGLDGLAPQQPRQHTAGRQPDVVAGFVARLGRFRLVRAVVEAAGDYTVQSMEKGRKFLRFGDFVNWLSARWASRDPDETVADLYPEMIGWFDGR